MNLKAQIVDNDPYSEAKILLYTQVAKRELRDPGRLARLGSGKHRPLSTFTVWALGTPG